MINDFHEEGAPGHEKRRKRELAPLRPPVMDNDEEFKDAEYPWEVACSLDAIKTIEGMEDERRRQLLGHIHMLALGEVLPHLTPSTEEIGPSHSLDPNVVLWSATWRTEIG